MTVVDSTHVIEGLSTRVRVSGQGQPLLLIGGVWSQVPMFDPVLPFLDGFRTIAFDPPGIGETAMPARPYSVQRLAGFAAGVLAAVGVGRAHVLGVSLGGAVAQQLARSHPERVDRLVLVSTGPGTSRSRPAGRPAAVRPTHGLHRHHRRSSSVPGSIFGGRLREQPELVRGWHLRPPASTKAWLYRLAGTTGWSSLPWLHRLTQPTLIVHGDDDPIVPLVNARLIACRMPDARLEVVEGGGHLLLLDSAADVVPIITGFLTRTTHRPT